MCENNVNVGFGLTLGTDDVSKVLNDIDIIVEALLKAAGLSKNQTECLTLYSVKKKSVGIDGTIDPTAGGSTSSSAAASASAALSSAITSGTSIGSYSVTSSSVVTNGFTITETTTTNSNLALILGLSIGIPVFLSNFYCI